MPPLPLDGPSLPLPEFAPAALVLPPDVFFFFLSGLLLPKVLPVTLSAPPPEVVLVVLVVPLVPPASAEDGASEIGAMLSPQVKIAKSAIRARVNFMIIPP